MSAAKTCPQCSAPLPADAPDRTLCSTCSQSASAQTIIMKGPSAGFETIGDYEVLGKLGHGGMGAVYRVRQISLDRLVALKVLPQQFADDPDFVTRFQREARVATSFHHANLVAVYSSGQADGVHYIAMELVEGENLHQRLKRGSLPIVEALRICADVARGLQYGWEQAQLVHRDIKPSNIYVSDSGVVKLGDLGLAKSLSSNTTGITHTGAMMGTPHYMSPEQARGDKSIDFHADIYSLGCTLYEMLAGQPPFSGADPLAIVRKHMDSSPPSLLTMLPGCPMPLARLVGKMLKKYKLERHLTYALLIAEIEQVSALIESGEARPSLARTAARTTPAPVKEPFEWTSTIVGALILLAIAVIFLPKPAKKLSELAVATPVAAKTTPRVSPIAAATPSATLTPAALAFTPWQPLFTDAEWQQATPSQREVLVGRRRLPATTFVEPQPAADGAIRARIQYQEKSNGPGFNLRSAANGARIKISVQNDRAIVLSYVRPGSGSNLATSANTVDLGTYILPKPLQPGDSLLLELRLQGNRLTALVDGAVVIEAQNPRDPGPGEWGLVGNLGCIESVEVQTPLPATAASGVQTFGGHRYQFVPESVSWTEAKTKAEAMGGHLATITSQAETDWIVTAFRDRVVGYEVLWLGGVRDAEAGAWRWVTGEPFEYTNWYPGQPNANKFPAFIAQNFHRAYGKDPGWNDVFHADQNALSGLKGFLVEWDSPAGPPTVATKDAPFVNSLGMKFVPVPGTDVLFCIHETRWRDYAAFAGVPGAEISARGKDITLREAKNGLDIAAAHMSWDEAQAFCAWLSRQEGRTYRLPTDREWSCAVGIGEQETWNADTTPATVNQIPDQFPWGTAWPPPKGAGNYRDESAYAQTQNAKVPYLKGYDDGMPLVAPVMSFTANRLGIYDLGGNVGEWVADGSDATPAQRTLRGAGYGQSTRAELLSSKRAFVPPHWTNSGTGFRVVLVRPAPPAASRSAPAPAPTTRALFAWTGPVADLDLHESWALALPDALYLAATTKGWFVSEVKAKPLAP